MECNTALVAVANGRGGAYRYPPVYDDIIQDSYFTIHLFHKKSVIETSFYVNFAGGKSRKGRKLGVTR
ncbi:hypothetical protein CK934_22630 [Chitinophaga sp. MD30]|nr:hypothetical protein CK934_22630 [Chitinophaga sp. MD30]